MNLYIQSDPQNPSGNLVFLFRKTKTFVSTQIQSWSYSFDSVGYGSQNQMFDALQWV